MATEQLPERRREIERSVARIVDQFHPVRVILFGSHAYGTPSSDSDVDLLVIMETETRPVEKAVEIRAAVEFPFPTDLLVRTPQQVHERQRLGDPFFREIADKGLVLYEAADARVG